MSATSARIRVLGLLAAGSLLVHELTPRDPHGSPSTDSAHGYIPLAGAAVALLLLAAGALFVRELLIAHPGDAVARTSPSFRTVWLAASGWLSGVYLFQEWLEATATGADWIFSAPQPEAFVFALLVGALIALLLRGAEKALRVAAEQYVAPLADDRSGQRRWRQPDRPRLVALACHLAGRGPPPLVR